MPPERAGPVPGTAWFIYYRVDSPQGLKVIVQARGLIAEACTACPGLRGQLMQRPQPDAATGELTLMEIYHLPPTLDAPGQQALQVLLSRLAHERLGAALAGRRHLEVFEPCA
ncbi:DUF4936 family protein [Ideonella sp. 4Y11]|uniref:DUF4936 family protein n=1 Tax=Ideonella aquatica TaxID=2824119 RepID=A0A940YFX8_9BURK|nr:DUF4936 family protein [Ideonella aquatica]MBQ0959420.1 DUF4936 family protein [Ideonella aquatica]